MRSFSGEHARSVAGCRTLTISAASFASSMLVIVMFFILPRMSDAIDVGNRRKLPMKVTFSPIGNTAESKANETIMEGARRAGVPLGNSCGGIGICNRCKVSVVKGAKNLPPPTRFEKDPGQRLACQAVVLGDCTVTTSYW